MQACKEGVPDLSFGPSTVASSMVLPDLQGRCSVTLSTEETLWRQGGIRKAIKVRDTNEDECTPNKTVGKAVGHAVHRHSLHRRARLAIRSLE